MLRKNFRRAKQFQTANFVVDQMESHMERHHDAYVFAAGLIVGALGNRLMSRPQVVVNLAQGATSGN